jgi:DNA-binding LacI/PurR family transcriptional regulator
MRTFGRTFASSFSQGNIELSSRVTIKEVAQRAGVSYQTVSKLLNGQARLLPATQARIMQAVEELQYHPLSSARSLRSRRSRTLGYSWVPSAPEQANQILDTLLQSMLQAAELEGYHLLCFPHHPEPGHQLDGYRELYETGRVDGFVLSSIEYDDPRVLYLLERGVPFVAFGRSNPELEFACIDVDGGQGMRLATRHLLALGHTRIAALAWPESSRVGDNRMQGYLDGLSEAGITPRPEWIRRGEGLVGFGRKATAELLDLPASLRPTAIIAFNDPMAIGAIQTAQRRGLEVGRDLAVTGFDDTPLARFLHPTLTSLRQPTWEIGQRLIRQILGMLDAEGPLLPGCALVSPELIVRASTQPGSRDEFDQVD